LSSFSFFSGFEGEERVLFGDGREVEGRLVEVTMDFSWLDFFFFSSFGGGGGGFIPAGMAGFKKNSNAAFGTSMDERPYKVKRQCLSFNESFSLLYTYPVSCPFNEKIRKTWSAYVRLKFSSLWSA
jgi:hypothetical protein